MPTKYEQPYPRGADAKHILASLLTQECSTHLSTKWVNARNEEVKECNEMPTKGKGDKGIRMAVKAFGLVIRIQKGREYPGCPNCTAETVYRTFATHLSFIVIVQVPVGQE